MNRQINEKQCLEKVPLCFVVVTVTNFCVKFQCRFGSRLISRFKMLHAEFTPGYTDMAP
jgi:hypothetical protein